MAEKQSRRRATNEQRHSNAESAKKLIDASSTKHDAFAQVAESTGFSAGTIRNHFNEFFGDEMTSRRARSSARSTTGGGSAAARAVTDEAVAEVIIARYRALDGDRAEYERQISELREKIEAIEPTRARLVAAAEALGIGLPRERDYEREPVND